MLKNQHRGFSMIELLIAIAIIGILASIAVPSYGKYVKESRRIDAQIALRNGAQVMERCRTQSFTYLGCDTGVPTNSPDSYYTVGVSDITATAFLITATPTTGKSQASDTHCTTLTFNQRGQTGQTPAANTDCW